MKKILTISLLLITSVTFAQTKTVIKVQGQPGIYGLANNTTGDSLIWYVQGVRHAVLLGGAADLSNYYDIVQVNDLLGGKADTIQQKLVGFNPIYFEQITADSANIKFRNDSVPLLTYAPGVDTSGTNAMDVPVKKWVLDRIASSGGGTVLSVTGSSTGLVDNTDPANPVIQQDALKLNISDSAAMLATYPKRQELKDTAAAIRAAFPTGNPVVKQTYTTGTTVTISNSTTWLIINPASTVAALAITMPVSPTDGQKIEMSFGGTVTSGVVVTALTITPNSGQTILSVSSPTTLEAGETVMYRFNSSNSIWYRL